MENTSEKFDFQIILESEEVEESSTYWQKQCHMLYDQIRKKLPEGSIDPSSRKGREGEKADIIISFDVLTFTGVTLNSFYVLIKFIDVWERNRKKANVKLNSRNGDEFVLSNLSVDEALEIYRNLQQEDNEQE
ncbi:hypothetical protein MSMTP_0319 [Methanosarcina sp. MTP4]|uniref:hypothetical protein n=1 Tax=Methanosarcina sp. MTP4 TaxID=1434100 RepID=UPI000615B509|nr:hypothetical protein [Methanosarcina sp. MTP4]AKB23788.1 hypothetical protein MSMTP_0319 [Methanosarcina sp. MTP4]